MPCDLVPLAEGEGGDLEPIRVDICRGLALDLALGLALMWQRHRLGLKVLSNALSSHYGFCYPYYAMKEYTKGTQTQQ